jgi:hypothetical protein
MAARRKIRVAILDDGEHRRGVDDVVAALLTEPPNIFFDQPQTEFCTEVITATQLCTNNGDYLRESFDVVVVPGGSSSQYGEKLGPEGLTFIREFVRAGGGYVGICAGAFLATSGFNPEHSLGLLDLELRVHHSAASSISTPSWATGRGMVNIRFTDEGTKLFGGWESESPTRRTKKGTVDEKPESVDTVSIRYSNGPLFQVDDSLPNGLLLLAIFDSEIALGSSVALQEAESASDDSSRSTDGLVGAGAIVAAPFGAGCVVCLSPHAESTPSATVGSSASRRRGSKNPSPNDLTRVVRQSVVLALSWWAMQDLLSD